MMDEVEKFADWFLSKSSVIGAIPLLGAVSKIEDVVSVLMYRAGQFQVQMFIVPPDYTIPPHIHPNVDSIEVYMGGQIKFSHSGEFVISDDELNEPTANGLPKCAGKLIRVRPNDWHGGEFGAGGGVFLSIQNWLNGVAPHCVAADYTGVVMGPDHLSKVKFGDAVL